MTAPNLPAWATLRDTQEGRISVVDVDADGMYQAWFAALKAHYETTVPDEFKDGDALAPEWESCLAELDAPTAYWLEVAYQCGKMELQIAMGTPAFEIHIHDPDKKYAQKDASPGRGAAMAAGGIQGSHEARDHFKRLRGFIPS